MGVWHDIDQFYLRFNVYNDESALEQAKQLHHLRHRLYVLRFVWSIPKAYQFKHSQLYQFRNVALYQLAMRYLICKEYIDRSFNVGRILKGEE